MEFSQSPDDVHIYFARKVHAYVKFAHFRQFPHGCRIHLKILHGCMILSDECEKNGKHMKIHYSCVIIIIVYELIEKNI